jgi:hypothetical protein
MKKPILLSLCLISIMIMNGFSQGSYTSTNNRASDWTDPAAWTAEFGWMNPQNPTTNFAGSYVANVYGYMTVNGDFSVTGNSRIEVYDTLVIIGNLTMGNSGVINVRGNGLLIVLGDFLSTGNPVLALSGGGRAAMVGEYEQQQGAVTTGSAYYIYDTAPSFTSGGCNGGASVDGTSYTCPPPNTAALTNLLDDYNDLHANDPVLEDFIESLGVTCPFSNLIKSSQALCTGSTVTLTGNAVSGTVVYRWESSTTSATTGFTLATGTSNAANYSTAALTQSTWFRRSVTRSGCTDISSAIKIDILASGSWTGNTSTAWNIGTNWCGGVPTSTIDAIVPLTTNGRYPSISSAANCRDLQINSGAQVTVASNSLNIYGNVFNNGMFTATANNTVSFTGSAVQTVSGNALTFHTLVVNNAAGITFQTNAIVTNTLTLTSGKVNLSGNKLTLGTGTGSIGVLSNPVNINSGFLNGSFERWIPASTVLAIDDYRGYFPMATATNRRPFGISYPTSGARPTTAGTLIVTHTGATTVSVVNINDGAGINITRRQDSFWSITSGNGLAGGTYIVKAGGTGFGTVAALSDVRLMRSNNIIGANGTATGSTTDFQAARTGVTLANLLSSFYIGSINATNTPLPVKLLNFSAEESALGILLKWSTSLEKNFDRFEVERSVNGSAFEYVTSVRGKGESTIKTDYTAVDQDIANGQLYYRLKSIDLDGTYEYSKIVSVLTASGEGKIIVYPNPVRDRKITVNIPQAQSPGTLLLSNQMGTPIFKTSVLEGEQVVELGDNIKPGLYFAKITIAGLAPVVVKLQVD